MTWLPWIVSNVLLASLLALVAVFVQRRLGLSAARILWVLVLVKLVTPPLVSVPVVEFPSSVACALGVCSCAPHAGAGSIVGFASIWILLSAWVSGAVATGWTAWRRWTQFRRLIALGSAAPPEWQALAKRLSAELSIKCPEILAMPGRLPPLVVPAWRRSRMLLPADLLDQLDDSQRVALLVHELVHIKRGDHLVRMLELAVNVAYWWLPGVGSIGRQLRACEETCCDAAVVNHLPQARCDYARLLLDVVDFANPLPRQAVPQATAMSVANDLEQRLRGILDAKRPARRAWPGAVIAIGAAGGILPFQLHYDFVERTVAAATSANRQSSAESTLFPGKDGCEPVAPYCCPRAR